MAPQKKKISWLAKLKPQQVRSIRKLAAKGWSQDKIAQRFQVSQSSIHNILRGITYREV